MSEQRLLFAVVPPTFATRLWRRMPPEARREALAVLAEMIRRGLTLPAGEGEEERDED